MSLDIKIDNTSLHADLPPHFMSGWRFRMLLLTVILSVIGYFLFTLWAGWEHVMAAFIQVGISGIVMALSLSLANYFLRFLRWRLFLSSMGHQIPFTQHLRIYMSGFSLTTTPGKTGEAIRGLFLTDYGVPLRKSFGAFLAERLSDLLSLTILASGGLWIYPEGRPILLIVTAIMAFILFAVQRNSWLKAAERLAKKILPQRMSKGIEFLLETAIAFRSCFSSHILFTTLLLGVLAWTAEGIALYWLLHFVGYDLDLLTAIFIYGFSLVIGGISMMPGGLGGAEVTMLQLLLLNHLPTSVAVALTLVVRLTTLWFSVFLGLLALPKKFLWRS